MTFSLYKNLYEHITEADYLASDLKASYQYIIGNPPWGYEFSESEKEKLRKNYRTASGKNIESYDLFIEKALRNLSINGQLSFILPEAILNVKAHTPVRTAIMESNSIRYLNFWEMPLIRFSVPALYCSSFTPESHFRQSEWKYPTVVTVQPF